MTPEEFMEETIRYWTQCNCNKSFGAGMRDIMVEAGLLAHHPVGYTLADEWAHVYQQESEEA